MARQRKVAHWWAAIELMNEAAESIYLLHPEGIWPFEPEKLGQGICNLRASDLKCVMYSPSAGVAGNESSETTEPPFLNLLENLHWANRVISIRPHHSTLIVDTQTALLVP